MSDLSITFGDGCDSDTLTNVLGGLVGYSLELQTALPFDLPDTFDVKLLEVAPAGLWGVSVARSLGSGDDAQELWGEPEYLDLDFIRAILIY